MPDDSSETTQGGVNLGDGSQVTTGGDVTGRDKTVAGGHIIHAEAGSTVIIGEKPAAPATADEAPAPGVSPFKGLQYFDEADAELFFGREALVEKLVERVGVWKHGSVGEGLPPHPPPNFRRPSPFLAIIGASGSGKSSLVRAGLIPALRREHPDWPIHVITPTAQPLESLAISLTRDSESVTAAETLINDLKQSQRSLHLYVRKLLSVGARGYGSTGEASRPHPHTPTHLLLVVDQFEELFTACKDEAERKAFIDNLMTAINSPSPAGAFPAGEGAGGWGGPTLLILTLRADFYAHCAQYDTLREAVAKQQEYIGPMTADELRRAIEEPAKRGNWELEPGLVETLLKDVGAGENRQPEPGGLPLLSHALLETWKRRRGRKLTLRGYAESGEVRGAIARTAESVYSRLTPLGQIIARRIFISLTELGEGTQDTRRRAALGELSPNPDEAANVQAVLKLLADERLVTTDEKTAEVAHEALIREWPTLRGWLNEDREGLRLHRQLAHDANEWARLNRDEGALYRGARLAQAAEWVEKHDHEMSALERKFVATSLELAEREVAEREAQQRRELEAAQKLAEIEKRRAEDQTRSATQLRKVQRYLQAGVVILLIFAVMSLIFGSQASLAANRNATLAAQNEIIAGIAQAASTQVVAEATKSAAAEADAITQRDEAERQASIVRARTLVEQSQVAFGKYPIRSLLLAIEAQHIAEQANQRAPAAEQALRNALTNMSGIPLTRHENIVRDLAFSSNGKWLVTGSDDGAVRGI